jgi:negative regulator of flagellin synthesis FlgM
MPIEINGSSTPQTRQTGEGGPLRVVRTSAETPQDSHVASGKDTVSLTGIAALLQQIDNRIASLPVIDTARVNSIRQSIADGNYHPDLLRTADRLIDQEISLLGGG